MPFIFTTNFAEQKLVKKALQSFYGIGPLISQQIMARHHIYPGARVGSLANQKLLDLTAELSTMNIENDKRREMNENIERLWRMGSYRGRRHFYGLPVRGQNTRSAQTNSARRLNRIPRRG